jgi:hypothetical protein
MRLFQHGFGYNITVDAEIAKLSLVVRVAREIWG